MENLLGWWSKHLIYQLISPRKVFKVLPFFIFFSSFSTSSAAAPSNVKMIPACNGSEIIFNKILSHKSYLPTWELTPTAVTRTFPEPSMTWVPDKTIGSTVAPFLTWKLFHEFIYFVLVL